MAADVIDLAAGRDHSLVLYGDAVLTGWGGDGTGRFPVPAGVCAAPSNEGDAVYISHRIELQQVTASAGVSWALDRRGTAYAWGANRAGLGGRIQQITQSQPRALPGLPALREIRGSEFFTLACSRDGDLYHWGLQPGSVHSVNHRPARIPQAPKVLTCATGGAHVLLLDTAHQLWVWGGNTSGQLGLADLRDQALPVLLPTLNNVHRIAAGASHSLAIAAKGQVWGWGSNQHGQIGDLRHAFYDRPQKIALPEPITEVAAGQYVSYALGRSGRVYGWGWNAKGQLGQGHVRAVDRIQTMAMPAPIRLLAAGQGHVLVSDGKQVWGWGDNSNRQLGTPARTEAAPVLLAAAS